MKYPYTSDEHADEIIEQDPAAWSPAGISSAGAVQGTQEQDPYEYPYVCKSSKDADGNTILKKTKCDYNIKKYLHDGGILDDVRFNDFAERLEIRKGKGRKWTRMKDAHLLEIRARLDVDPDFRGMTINKKEMYDYILCVAEHSDPVKDLLELIRWDGIPRIDTFFADKFGADKNVYTAEALRLFLIAAIARVYDPGCKFDNMLILQGKQATGKSTFFRVLGETFGRDAFGEIGSAHIKNRKLLGEDAAGKIILEYSELDGMKQARSERLKATITSQNDQHRMSYGVLSEEFPRKYVIGGTTNSAAYLTDPTGNRRFWPIPIKQEYILDDDTALQLWAEAYELYKAGGYQLYLSDAAEALAEEYRGEVTQLISDDFAPDILDFVDGVGTPSGTPMQTVTVKMIFDGLSITPEGSLTALGRMKYIEAKTIIQTVLERNGWTYKSVKVDGRPVYRYKRPTPSAE